MDRIFFWNDQAGFLWHECSAVLVINQQNKLLVFNRLVFPLMVTVPAGHLEEQETPLDAAKRELKEEAGLIVDKLKYLGHQSYHRDYCRHGASRHRWHFFIYHLGSSQAVAINRDEGSRPRWLGLDQTEHCRLAHAISLGLDYYKPILKKIMV